MHLISSTSVALRRCGIGTASDRTPAPERKQPGNESTLYTHWYWKLPDCKNPTRNENKDNMLRCQMDFRHCDMIGPERTIKVLLDMPPQEATQKPRADLANFCEDIYISCEWLPKNNYGRSFQGTVARQLRKEPKRQTETWIPTRLASKRVGAQLRTT